MNIFDQLQPIKLLKIGGAVLVVVIVLGLLAQFFGLGSDSDVSISHTSKGYGTQESALGYSQEYYADDAAGLSVRNVASVDSAYVNPSPVDQPAGDDLEEFEVTTYDAAIESQNIEHTCKLVYDLKVYEYVVFEHSNSYDTGCSYSFKVQQDHVAEVLAGIEALDPVRLAEYKYTIKALVEDYTSETEILQAKLESIDQTLENAIGAYDELAELATNTQDVESLTKIVDNKIRLIERLTEQRIAVNAELERIARAKAHQLDRLEYTYFTVQVTENKYVDVDGLKDSWQRSVKAFVRDINTFVQDLTINLIAALLLAFKVVVYVLIALIIAKYGWKFIKEYWNK